MLDEADKDGDGKISQQEFVQVMLKTNLFRWPHTHTKNINLSTHFHNTIHSDTYNLCQLLVVSSCAIMYHHASARGLSHAPYTVHHSCIVIHSPHWCDSVLPCASWSFWWMNELHIPFVLRTTCRHWEVGMEIRRECRVNFPVGEWFVRERVENAWMLHLSAYTRLEEPSRCLGHSVQHASLWLWLLRHSEMI